MGELADELTHVRARRQALESDGMAPEQAFQSAVAEQQEGLRGELADCLAYLLKLANYTGIDLDAAYLPRWTPTAAGNGGVSGRGGRAGCHAEGKETRG